MTIEQMLDQLAELQSAVDLLNLKKAEAIEAILTPAIKAAIAEVELECAPQLDEARQKISALEVAVKAAVIECGATVKGQRMQAVYMKGRITWNTKALDGYALKEPALLAFRTEGAPSVSLRAVK